MNESVSAFPENTKTKQDGPIDEYDDYDKGGSSIPPLYPLTTSNSSVKL
jgi:hypothetical protein